jgi:rod shape-determining protein MreD
MRWLRFSFLLLVVAFVQGSSLPDIVAVTKSGARPDFLLILLVFFALHCYGYEAVITSFAIGFAADIVNQAIGPYLISFGLFGAFLGSMRQVIAIRRTLHVVGTVVASGIAAGLLAQLLGLIKGQSWQPDTFSLLLGSAIYSGLLAPYIFSGLLSIIDWLGVKKYHFTR